MTDVIYAETIILDVYPNTIVLDVIPVIAPEIIISSVGIQGVPGSSGSSGQLLSNTYQATQNLSGERILKLNNSGLLDYADNTNPNDLNVVLGLSIGAIYANAYGNCVTYGEVNEVGWNWTPGLKLWLSTNGQITQTVPSTGFLLCVGKALSPTKIFFNFGLEVLLS